MNTEFRLQEALKTKNKITGQDKIVRMGKQKHVQKMVWKRSVIQDELKRPLTVNNDFLSVLQKQHERQVQVQAQTEKHRKSHVTKLNSRSQERKELTSRQDEFKVKKKQLFT